MMKSKLLAWMASGFSVLMAVALTAAPNPGQANLSGVTLTWIV